MVPPNYRALALAALVLLTAPGCSQLGGGGTETAWYNATDCRDADLTVSYDPSVPDDVTVKNATTDGYLDVEPIAGILESAQTAYESRSLETASEPVELADTGGDWLFEYEDSIDEIHDSGRAKYVEYEGVTYRLHYTTIEC